MKMYICKLCTTNQMLLQSKFCLIIVQKPITAFARIRPLSSRTPPSTRMRVSPSDTSSPHYIFRSASPASCQVNTKERSQAYHSCHLMSSDIISLKLSGSECVVDWSQPRRTGSLHSIGAYLLPLASDEMRSDDICKIGKLRDGQSCNL